MKRALSVGAALGLTCLAGAALAGIRLAPTTNTRAWTNCDGGLSQTVPAGSHVASFKDETVWLCIGDAGCAAGGHFFLPGSIVPFDFPVDTPVSCRSDGMTGDLVMTPSPI